MKADPILEEVWRTKDRLAAEAGYDVDVFLEQLRAWSAAHPPVGPLVHGVEELRRLATEEGTQRYPTVAAEPLGVRETPSAKRTKARGNR